MPNWNENDFLIVLLTHCLRKTIIRGKVSYYERHIPLVNVPAIPMHDLATCYGQVCFGPDSLAMITYYANT